MTVQPLRKRLSPKTLLQRLEPLRPLQTPHRPVPLAPPSLVTAAESDGKNETPPARAPRERQAGLEHRF